MENRFDEFPKNVQRLVKKLADIEREMLAMLRAHYPDEESRAMKLVDKGDQAVKDLFATSFVKEELGLELAMGSDALHALADYFLGIYALDRLYAEEDGEKYSEDLFYAGGHLKQSADMLEDMEYEDMADDMLDDMNAGELAALLDELAESSGVKPAKTDKSKVVPLFGEKKGKKNKE